MLPNFNASSTLLLIKYPVTSIYPPPVERGRRVAALAETRRKADPT